MPVRLIVSDLDSTLIGEDVTLSPRTVEAFRRAREAGVMTTLASGRMYDAMERFVQQLGIDMPVLSCQGGVVVDPVSGSILSTCPVPMDLGRDFLHFAADHGVYAQYYSNEGYYMERDCPESEHYARLAGVKGIPVGGPLWEKLDFDPQKSLIIAPPPVIQTLLPIARERYAGKLEVTTSMPNYLEITHPDANKGYALRKLAAALDVDMADIMAFGDAPNDISMIASVGYGVAVGNAHPSAKEAAWYVTDSRENDGVARAIGKFVLGEEV